MPNNKSNVLLFHSNICSFFFVFSDSVESESVGSSSGATKSKHREDDEAEEENEARHDAKRLKFEEDNEENQKDLTEEEISEKESSCSAPAESSSDEESSLHSSAELGSAAAPNSEDQGLLCGMVHFMYGSHTIIALIYTNRLVSITFVSSWLFVLVWLSGFYSSLRSTMWDGIYMRINRHTHIFSYSY